MINQYVLLPLRENILMRQDVLLPCRYSVLVYQHQNVLSIRSGALVRDIHVAAHS